MAIFHCQVKVVSRATGRSSVAASAYRSGTSLHNDKEGRTYDFSRRSGVVQADIVIPKGSGGEWALD
ncbi:MobA/MobL family protein, partial [Escherichia coli]|uniref:MobA/MobL family protein n=2 Tax=Pseudomonadota TaxID=1224 RepID=UPI0013B3E1E8